MKVRPKKPFSQCLGTCENGFSADRATFLLRSAFMHLAGSCRNFLVAYGKALASFGAMQAMQIVLPLLALPILARRLGPDSFGLLMFFCLLPPLAALLADWGFALGGARLAASARGDEASLSHILAAVCGAKLLIAAAIAVLAALCMPLVPHASQYPLPYALAILAGIARGLNPAWFFQGSARNVPFIALLDVAASLTVLVLVMFCIHTPAHWYRYLLFLAVAKATAYGAAHVFLWRRYGVVLNLSAGAALLKRQIPLCASAFSPMFCYNGGQIVLGFFLSSADMGILVAVNKMIRALGSVLNPFTMTLFPEICIWRQQDENRTRHALRLSLLLTSAGAIFVSVMVALIAPWLIHIALGPAYAAAVPALRLALLAIPFMACNNVLGQQVLVPFGQDKGFLASQFGAALLTLPLAALLGYSHGLHGGAVLPVCAELMMFLGLILTTIKKCPRAFVAGGHGEKNFR